MRKLLNYFPLIRSIFNNKIVYKIPLCLQEIINNYGNYYSYIQFSVHYCPPSPPSDIAPYPCEPRSGWRVHCQFPWLLEGNPDSMGLPRQRFAYLGNATYKTGGHTISPKLRTLYVLVACTPSAQVV